MTCANVTYSVTMGQVAPAGRSGPCTEFAGNGPERDTTPRPEKNRERPPTRRTTSCPLTTRAAGYRRRAAAPDARWSTCPAAPAPGQPRPRGQTTLDSLVLGISGLPVMPVPRHPPLGRGSRVTDSWVGRTTRVRATGRESHDDSETAYLRVRTTSRRGVGSAGCTCERRSRFIGVVPRVACAVGE